MTISEHLPSGLLQHSKSVSLRKAETLFQPGDAVNSLYYVCEGQLKAVRYQLDGKPAVMMQTTSDNFFATSSITMDVYPCAAIAVVNSKVLQIPKEHLVNYLESDPAFSLFFINSLSQDLKKQCSNAERLRLKSAKDRIIHFITCESPSGSELELDCPLTKWADELGIEPESLYRSLAEMEADGSIQRDKHKITLLSIPTS